MTPMVARKRITTTPAKAARTRARLENPPGSYFSDGADRTDLEFTSTGCALVDEALGGGPVMGRVINIVGDKSTGKTQMAMEVIAQTFMRIPNAWGRYGEAEAAWDPGFARALGIPVDRMILNAPGKRIETIEQWYEDLEACLEKHAGRPGVYVIDSLDAMSDAAEMDSDFNEASFGGNKPKAIGQLFRRLVGRLEAQGVLLVVVSQLRDKIGAMFGETKTRSGGKALDFYATHIMWLREMDKIKRTVSGVERVVGFNVEAVVKKNKAGLAFRKARYPVLFGYGIDDLTSMVEWLIDVGRERELAQFGMRRKTSARARTRAEVRAAEPETKKADDGLRPYEDVLRDVRDEGGPRAAELREALTRIVRREWARVELDTLPKARKYG